MKAIYLTMREVVPLMKANPKGPGGIRGVVLNMASTAGVSPRPRLGWYNASKGWVITATRANAVELAPFGIRVVALNPVASPWKGNAGNAGYFLAALDVKNTTITSGGGGQSVPSGVANLGTALAFRTEVQGIYAEAGSASNTGGPWTILMDVLDV